MTRRLVLGALAISLVFAGCGTDESAPTTDQSVPNEASETASTSPLETSVETAVTAPSTTRSGRDLDENGALVVLDITGGITGRADTLLLLPTGELETRTAQGVRESTLSESTVAEVETLLGTSGLFDRDREYLGEGADLQLYVIRYSGVTLIADDASIPAELIPALERLESLMRP